MKCSVETFRSQSHKKIKEKLTEQPKNATACAYACYERDATTKGQWDAVGKTCECVER